MMCIMVRECSHHINVCLIKVWTGVTGNRPLDRVPDGEVVDLEGLYSSMYCFGQNSHEATGLVNFAKRIWEWIRKGKAQLHRDEAIYWIEVYVGVDGADVQQNNKRCHLPEGQLHY